MSISTRWAQAALFFVLAVGSGAAFAEQYRFEWGPHPGGCHQPGRLYGCCSTLVPDTGSSMPGHELRPTRLRSPYRHLPQPRCNAPGQWHAVPPHLGIPEHRKRPAWGNWGAIPGLSVCSTDPRCAPRLSITLWAPGVLSIGDTGTVTIQVTRDGAPAPGVGVSTGVTSGVLDGCSGATTRPARCFASTSPPVSRSQPPSPRPVPGASDPPWQAS